MISAWQEVERAGLSFKAVAGQGFPEEFGGILASLSFSSRHPKSLFLHLAPLPCFSLTICSLLGPQGNFGDAGPTGVPVSILQMAVA